MLELSSSANPRPFVKLERNAAYIYTRNETTTEAGQSFTWFYRTNVPNGFLSDKFEELNAFISR